VPDVFQVDEAEPDLAALDEQTRRLISAAIFMAGAIGLWATWSEVLPAFNVLERFALWHYSGLVDGTEQRIPVTVADIGVVALIIVVATIAARNLPALLEILLLQSNTLSAGARYTIKTLSSYLITTVAFLMAFATLGLQWGQIQWLVAALGVGIGFGLQEIIGNFISGLIILFERPVRVGDIVTIGDTTGVVTNIRIRATTIRNWDKQELLVPNKEFITGRLLNWTLTDQQNRISIPIGIEYGSDTEGAGTAGAHRRRARAVLDDPAPLVGFEGFSDNALTLVLRCYMDSLDGRIGVITELNQKIYDTFRAEGVRSPSRSATCVSIRTSRSTSVYSRQSPIRMT
jgi:potassium-dependent mechanosensitive channel